MLRKLRDVLREHGQPQWNGKLAHLPQPSFADRIQELAQDLPDVLRERVLGHNLKGFVARVKNIRNAEAHRIMINPPTSGIELARLGKKLEVLVDFALWTKLGLTRDEVSNAIEHCRQYRYYAYNETWPWDRLGD